MAKITIDYTTLCGEGHPARNTGFGFIPRQKVNCVSTPLTASKSYSLIKVPKGFIARHAVVNIITPSATAITLSFGSNVKDGSGNQIVYNASVAADAVAGTMTLLDIDKPTETGDANVTAKTVADDSTYIVVIPSATLTDAVFEVSLAGDYMLDPSDSCL